MIDWRNVRVILTLTVKYASLETESREQKMEDLHSSSKHETPPQSAAKCYQDSPCAFSILTVQSSSFKVTSQETNPVNMWQSQSGISVKMWLQTLALTGRLIRHVYKLYLLSPRWNLKRSPYTETVPLSPSRILPRLGRWRYCTDSVIPRIRGVQNFELVLILWK